jgi:uncharacterized circularly permuted ATP-grasp superfamily protein
MDAVTRWHSLLEKHPRSREDFLGAVIRAGAVYKGEPLCVHRRPHLLTGPQVQRFARILATFHGIIRKICDKILHDGLEPHPGSLVSQLDLDPRALDLARIDPGYRSIALIARVDCFTPGGHPWILELNGESPAGIAYTDALTEVFDGDPIRDHFRNLRGFSNAEAVVRAALEVFRSWRGHTGAPPHVAIVDFDSAPTTPEFHLFAEHFHRAGVTCSVVDPRMLEFNGTHLMHGLARVDLVYRRLLVQDILQHPEETGALVAAYRAGAICMVNSLRTCLLHSKALFALMHHPDFQEHLTASERRVVQDHVPFTVRLSPSAPPPADALREALAQPDQWVLKPATGHGGIGVVLGWEASQGDWENALARDTPHVLQRRVPHVVLPFPDARDDFRLHDCVVDLDPFLIRGRLAGFLCRLSESHLANVTQGASVVPVFALP